MSLDILKERIKENNISGVFFFYGSEEYTKDHYASRIRKTVEDSPIPEFNHIYFNAASDSISELEDAVYSLPYMWENKLIEITDLSSAKFSESDIEDYARIFSDIPDYLTILMVLRASDKLEESKSESKDDKAPKGGIKSFINMINDHGLVVKFENEKSDKLITWITRHFNAKGVTFDYNVPREIINTCGADMYILQSEILKLSEAFSGKPLSVSDVRKYCCINTDFKYFDIANALNRRDIIMAKRILDSLNLNRDEISMAIGTLAKNYYQMLFVKSGIDSGKSYERIAKDLKIPQWLVKKISDSSGSVDIRTLNFAVKQLANADMKIKNCHGNPRRIVELAFYRICTYGRKA